MCVHRRGGGVGVQVFFCSFLFPPSAVSLYCLEDRAPCSCSFVLPYFSFQALSLSSSPGPFFPSSLFLHLLCFHFLATWVNTHTHTHLGCKCPFKSLVVEAYFGHHIKVWKPLGRTSPSRRDAIAAVPNWRNDRLSSQRERPTVADAPPDALHDFLKQAFPQHVAQTQIRSFLSCANILCTNTQWFGKTSHTDTHIV